jgi:hypothetical protein
LPKLLVAGEKQFKSLYFPDESWTLGRVTTEALSLVQKPLTLHLQEMSLTSASSLPDDVYVPHLKSLLITSPTDDIFPCDRIRLSSVSNLCLNYVSMDTCVHFFQQIGRQLQILKLRITGIDAKLELDSLLRLCPFLETLAIIEGPYNFCRGYANYDLDPRFLKHLRVLHLDLSHAHRNEEYDSEILLKLFAAPELQQLEIITRMRLRQSELDFLANGVIAGKILQKLEKFVIHSDEADGLNANEEPSPERLAMNHLINVLVVNCPKLVVVSNDINHYCP